VRHHAAKGQFSPLGGDGLLLPAHLDLGFQELVALLPIFV